MFRHREPFVRLGWLAVLEARPPDSERLPRGLIGEFLPLFICCCPRGLRAGVDMPCPSVEESGGPEQGARSGDLEAHQTLPPPPRNGTETWHGMAWPGMQDTTSDVDVRHQLATCGSSHSQHNGFLTCPPGGRICSSTAHEERICRIVWPEAQGQS